MRIYSYPINIFIFFIIFIEIANCNFNASNSVNFMIIASKDLFFLVLVYLLYCGHIYLNYELLALQMWTSLLLQPRIFYKPRIFHFMIIFSDSTTICLWYSFATFVIICFFRQVMAVFFLFYHNSIYKIIFQHSQRYIYKNYLF